MAGSSRRWYRIVSTAAVLVTFVLAATPASAAAGTVSTAAANLIGSTSAQLNGLESGYPSSDYCSFIYWPSGSPNSWQQANLPVACQSSYSITADAQGFRLTPDTRYSYAAIHCATTAYNPQLQCAASTPSGTVWDAIDPCYATPATCPSFTTGSSSGTVTSVAPPVRVGVVSALLSGTSTYSAGSGGSGNYCSFIVSPQGGSWDSAIDVPAVPCGPAYQVTIGGFNADTTVSYAAIHCAAVFTTSAGAHFCAPNGSYANPNNYDTVDSCLGHTPEDCPQFTTGTPTATTSAPSDVLGTSATLNGTLDIEDLTTDLSGLSSGDVYYYFEYSTDQSFGAYTSTPTQELPDAESFAPCPAGSTWPWCPTVSASVTGLQPGTTYYYRTVVEAPELGPNASYGNVISFTTGGRALTDPATAISASGATLNGELAPGDTALTYSWVYATSDNVQNGLLQGTTVAGGSVAAGQDQLLSTTLSGLLTGQSFYFQLVTSDPTIHGQVLSFTTAGGYCPAGATVVTRSAVPRTGFVVSGCFGSAGGVWTGYGSVTINGLSLPGPSTGTVTIDTNKDTLTTSAGFTLAIGRLLIASGKAGLSFSYTNTAQGSQVNVVPDPTASWFGFPMLGGVTITALSSSQTPAGGATVSVSALGLPALFGGITAQGSGTVNADGSLTGVQVQLGQSTLGPLTLPSFTLCYQTGCAGASTSACYTANASQTNTWIGDLELYFPLAPVGVGACAEVQNDQLNALGISYGGPGIPLGDSGLELTGVSANAIVNPLSFGGSITVSLGPKIDKFSLLSGTVGFNAAFNQNITLNGFSNVGIPDNTTLQDVPFGLTLTGQLQMLGFITLANASAGFYDVPGSPLVTASFAIGQPLTAKCPSWLGGGTFGYSPSFLLQAAADASGFDAYGEGGMKLDLCAITLSVGADALISTKGMAACVAIPNPFSGGDYYYALGVYWPATLPTSFSQFAALFQPFEPDQCDLSAYEANLVAVPARAARAVPRSGHAAAAGTLRLPGGLPFEVIRVTGNGTPPQLSVSGPHGLSIRMVPGQAMTESRGYLAVADPGNATTYVELPHPAAGAYHLAALPGSSGIIKVDAAHGLPTPTVRARVTGAGARRTLSWHARPVPGERLEFRELGAGGDRLLLATTRTRGRLSYELRPGLRGRRFVVVQVLYGGMLQKVLRIGSYSGPTISFPRRAARLAAVRTGGRLRIRWRQPGQRPASYLVLTSYPDHGRKLTITHAPRLILHAVPAKGRMSVTVTPVNALGQRGPSATVRVTKPHRKLRRR